MKVIEADHDRRYEIPGVPGSARKPVDIDAAKTGFQHLRSLRLYQFDAGSTIDGHAEDDEVFVVVTSGSVEMSIGWEDSSVCAEGVYRMAAPEHGGREPFVAYLPPGSVYRLTPLTTADVAYARAIPRTTRAPAVFGEGAANGRTGGMLLEDVTHGEKLRLRMHRIQAQAEEVTLELLEDADVGCEALVHVQGSPVAVVGSVTGPDGALFELRSWQTLAFEPGERAALRVPAGSDVSILTVLAS